MKIEIDEWSDNELDLMLETLEEQENMYSCYKAEAIRKFRT